MQTSPKIATTTIADGSPLLGKVHHPKDREGPWARLFRIKDLLVNVTYSVSSSAFDSPTPTLEGDGNEGDGDEGGDVVIVVGDDDDECDWEGVVNGDPRRK